MTTTTPTASVVQLLVETCRDGEDTFASAAGEISNAELRLCLEEMAHQRRQFANELEYALGEIGEEHEPPTHLIASLHRSWLNFGFVLSAGDDATILADCERTEARSEQEYHEALEMPDLHPKIRALVQGQRAAIAVSAERLRRCGLEHVL